MPSPTVAIVIPTYRREQVLVDTVRQVLSQDPAADEVLVVDQTPEHEPATEQYLSQQHASGIIRWIRHSPPSLPGARNRAVAETGADLVLFIDDDVELCPSFIEMHRRNFHTPGVTALVGQIRQAGLTPENNPTAIPERRPVRFLRGGNFTVWRKIFIEVGGFDENFEGAANGEEMDFAARLLANGHTIVCDPDAWLLHLKVPAGGCRIPGNQAMPQWKKLVSYYIYAFRHGRRNGDTWYWVKSGLRAGPLLRENVRKPWRWPGAWCSFIYAVWLGWRRARGPIRSPFADPAARQGAIAAEPCAASRE